MSEKTHQEKGHAESRPGSIQREESAGEKKIRATIKAIREGHTTGGYCDTEALKAEEKKLHAILATKLEAAEKERDQPAIKSLNREINSLAYKPRLVVAND